MREGAELRQILARFDRARVTREQLALDADVARFVASRAADTARLMSNQRDDLPTRRRVAEQVRQPWAAGGPRPGCTYDVLVPGPRRSRLRVYRAPAPGRPVLFYAHGGGWSLFSLDTHDRLMREYVERSGATVVAIEYALAPERRFPHALEQCVAAVRWLRQGPEALGMEVGRIVLGGDSAGANLALATALCLRAEGELRSIDGLLLNYGAFDVEIDPASRCRFESEGDLLTAEMMDDFWADYLGSAADRHDWRACPLIADLEGLPPTLLVVPELDVLMEQSMLLARRMRDAGVNTTQHVYPGATHSFLEAVSISSLAGRALDDTSRWLRELARNGLTSAGS